MADMDRVIELTGVGRIFAEYWLSLPKVDLVPMRSSFKPEKVPSVIPNMAIHELISPEFIRMRLVGTEMVKDYGQEVTNRNYLDFVEEGRREKASHAIHVVCGQPCGMAVQLSGVSQAGRKLVRSTVAFPMRNDEGQANLVYFCSSRVEKRNRLDAHDDELETMQVSGRVFLDIGAGLPAYLD
ncbi:MAG: PAS domain-containing protein [Rhodospirillaceae bacterium]|nr:PAS domain-containing protein [Rhodospirillaceae bacterium]